MNEVIHMEMDAMQGFALRSTALFLLVLCAGCGRQLPDNAATNEHGLIILSVPADDGLPTTAYDFVARPALRQRLYDYVLSRFSEEWTSNPDQPLVLRIKLADGSTAMIKQQLRKPPFAILAGTVQDRSNNHVPEDTSQLAGGPGQTTFHDFSPHPEDRPGFVAWMQSLGVSFAGQADALKYTCRSRVVDGHAQINCAGQYIGQPASDH